MRVTLACGKEVSVWPILAGAEGDMPILEKLCRCLGHAAEHACFRCALNGIWCPESNTMR